jgi:hypothetical protein
MIILKLVLMNCDMRVCPGTRFRGAAVNMAVTFTRRGIISSAAPL